MADPNINLTGGETHVSGDIIGGDVHHYYPPEPPREFTPPFQALADLQTFVGREDALQKLATLGAVGVTNPRFLIAGIGGLGKTTLAIHIAHQLRRVFSGGVLWADVPTTEPFSKLDEWARAYEGDVRDFQDLNARADRVRAIIQQRVGRKRVLAILDGVIDESDDANLSTNLTRTTRSTCFPDCCPTTRGWQAAKNKFTRSARRWNFCRLRWNS